MAEQAKLFGLEQSNRDFSKSINWGKNIFNNAFPLALTCYMAKRQINPVYITVDDNLKIVQRTISVETLFGIAPEDRQIYFAFESDFTPYRSLVIGNVPRADIVILHQESAECRSSLEIKLTALPDNSTYHLQDEFFGCEVVVRPDTIVYMALGIANAFRKNPSELKAQLKHFPMITDWTDIELVAPRISNIAFALDEFFRQNIELQRPLILQPIWKTIGRQLQLNQDAFDVFIWSDVAFSRLFLRDAEKQRGNLSRGARTIAWLAKMLLDFAETGKINHKRIIDGMSFNTKNDKAFAVNGRVTQPFMAGAELSKPRIKRDELRQIILGGGENLLSPERRLDAAILSTPNLFD